MFIGKTVLDKEKMSQIGSQLFQTKRTHKNDLVAISYMLDNDIDEYTVLRTEHNLDSLIKYSFCWAMSTGQFHKFADSHLNIIIEQIVDEDHNKAYVCFFTGTVRQWVTYCLDTDKPASFCDEVRAVLSQDGYSLLFKEAKKLK